MVNDRSTVLKTYAQTFNKPLEPYLTVDSQGKKVRILPKNPKKHNSDGEIEHRPTYYYNLCAVIQNPDKTVLSTSNNKVAIKASKEGKVIIYTKEDFVESLGIPGQYPVNEQTLVIVFYGNDGINFTKSYRSEVRTL